MSHVVFAWELGMGSGHVLGFLPIAQELRERGHEVTFIFKNLARAEAMLGEHGFRYLQAPTWLPTPATKIPLVNYADILARYGFLDKASIQGLVNAWRGLFELLKPDLLILDHAPTALLASKGTAIPCALLGTGFSSPPRSCPIPAFRSWHPVDDRVLIKKEQQLLPVINSVLTRTNSETLQHLCDLFQTDEDFLCTLEELDHYPRRGPARYWGPRFSLSAGRDPVWPPGNGKRIFVYMYLTYEGYESVIGMLDDFDISAIVYSPGISRQYIAKLQSARVVLVSEHLNMEAIRSECDICLCHAGHGTVAAMLLAGKPLLMFPQHAEQAIVARNVQKLGAGLTADMKTKSNNAGKLLKRLLTEESFTRHAKNFARKYEAINHQDTTRKIADRCETLMQGES